MHIWQPQRALHTPPSCCGCGHRAVSSGVHCVQRLPHAWTRCVQLLSTSESLCGQRSWLSASLLPPDCALRSEDRHGILSPGPSGRGGCLGGVPVLGRQADRQAGPPQGPFSTKLDPEAPRPTAESWGLRGTFKPCVHPETPYAPTLLFPSICAGEASWLQDSRSPRLPASTGNL